MKSGAPEEMASETPERDDTRVLVIGYGNGLRRDDGAGPAVARIIGEYGMPGVIAESYHQLLPEHAAQMARADLVIFVDASLSEADEISMRHVHPSALPSFCGHQFDPGKLLYLCDRMYSRVPEAWFIHIPGADFGMGEDLSPVAARHVRSAVSSVLRIIADQGIDSAPPSRITRGT